MSLFFNSKEKRLRESAEIEERLRNSDCTQEFIAAFTIFFNPGHEFYEWLLANSKERLYKIYVRKEGVLLGRLELNPLRYAQTNSYVVDSMMWGFGAAGFEDLPDLRFVKTFEKILFEEIKANCPNIKFVKNDEIMLADNVKKGW